MTGGSRAKVWVFSELYYPESSATGYYLTRIAEGLAADFVVGALCAQPTYSARGTRALRREVRHGVQIHRCWGTTLNKDVLAWRIVNLVTISLSIFVAAIRLLRAGDCVVAVTNPPTLPFLALLACRVRRARCVVLVHDVYPEVLTAAGMARKEGGFVALLQSLHRWLYGNADCVVTLGRDMQALVRKKNPGLARAPMIIPNWADSDQVRPMDASSNPVLGRLGLEGRFIVQYSGNMGRTHDIESVVQVARRLSSSSNIHFLLIGSGAKRSWLDREVAFSGAKNITVLDPLPRAELMTSLNACSVSLITLMPGMAGVSVPSRLYNILAAGKPMVAMAEPDSELSLVIREEGVGWVVPPGDVEALAAAVLEAWNRPDELAAMSRRAREAAETKYSFERVIGEYRRLVDLLAPTARPGESR